MTNANATKAVPTINAEVIRQGEAAYGLTLTFSNGKALSIRRDQLSAMLEAEAMIHGLKQKLVDAAAISRNPETGRSATVDDKYEAVKEVYDRLLSGSWNATREGSSAGSLLFKALCRMQPTKEAAVLREWLAKRTDEEKNALRKNPAVAKVIAEIQAESIKDSGIDSDALLSQLES